MKLELKHLAGYLPYGVNVKYKYSRQVSRSEWKEFERYNLLNGSYLTGNLDNLTPILRPLSDLNIHELRSDKNYPDLEVSQGSVDKLFKIEIGNDLQCFDISIFEYLLERHFDIYGLIENGLAIDINTLDV